MLSGNGRHRRPRQAPALIVAAGVTGSAIAIPLLGAGSASAADTSTWDRVADCESGGEWSADFGNGYYGGLQLTQETWESYGGTAYAPRADLASRSQQIAVAEMVLAAQGPSAWSNCAAITGLGESDSKPSSGSTSAAQGGAAESPSFGDGADAVQEPGGAAKPSAPATSGSGASAAEPSQKPANPSPAPSAPADSASGSGKAEGEGGTPADADAGAAPDAGSGKHRGTPAPEDEAGISGNEHDSARHASRGDGSARDAAATEDGYTVRPGDSLSEIADAHEVPGGWSALYSANEEVVGSDPDLILPGQSLDLGADEGQLTK